jgi:glycosyltransferase involved in cell wall biosynthesis
VSRMASRERQELSAPVQRAQVVFIVDRLTPRLGMEKAALAVIQALEPHAETGTVVIAGPPITAGFRDVVYLGHRPGLAGRLAALRDLRHVADSCDATFVAVGTWAAATFALATVGSARKFILWEHTVLPWRIRHEPSVTVCAIALGFLGRRLDRIVSVSQANARAVRGLTRQRVPTLVIPNPADGRVERSMSSPAPQPMRSSGRSIAVLGIGSLIPRKNWQLAIRALALLPQHFELRLAGDGPDRAPLSRLAHELGVGGRVTFLGHVESVDPLLDRADIVVHPSFAETFGYVLMEAAAHHKPVAVLDMPVMTEFVPTLVCGVLAGGVAPEEYARAMQEALSSDWSYDEADVRRRERLDAAAIRAAWLNVLSIGDHRKATRTSANIPDHMNRSGMHGVAEP